MIDIEKLKNDDRERIETKLKLLRYTEAKMRDCSYSEEGLQAEIDALLGQQELCPYRGDCPKYDEYDNEGCVKGPGITKAREKCYIEAKDEEEYWAPFHHAMSKDD